LAKASQPPAVIERPASACIIGRIGVNANRPTPMGIASATMPTSAVTTGERIEPRLDVEMDG